MSSLVGNIKRSILCLEKYSPQAMISLGSTARSTDVNGSIRPCIYILECPCRPLSVMFFKPSKHLFQIQKIKFCLTAPMFFLFYVSETNSDRCEFSKRYFWFIKVLQLIKPKQVPCFSFIQWPHQSAVSANGVSVKIINRFDECLEVSHLVLKG